MRLSASSFAGTARTLVAVGTVSDWFMFFAMTAAAPRSVVVRSPSAGRTGATLAAAAGAGLPVAGSPVVFGGVATGRTVSVAGGTGGVPLTWAGGMIVDVRTDAPTFAGASVVAACLTVS